MDVATFKAHTVSECHCCGKLIVAEDTELGRIEDLYRAHLESNPICKKWHDAIPSAGDVRGILSS